MGRKDLKTTQPTPTTCPARNDWDGDFGVDEWHGHNMFIREDQIYRTYSIGGRGSEIFGTVWSHLDMTALGRQGGVGGLAGRLAVAGPRRPMVGLQRRLRRLS